MTVEKWMCLSSDRVWPVRRLLLQNSRRASPSLQFDRRGRQLLARDGGQQVVKVRGVKQVEWSGGNLTYRMDGLRLAGLQGHGWLIDFDWRGRFPDGRPAIGLRVNEESHNSFFVTTGEAPPLKLNTWARIDRVSEVSDTPPDSLMLALLCYFWNHAEMGRKLD